MFWATFTCCLCLFRHSFSSTCFPNVVLFSLLTDTLLDDGSIFRSHQSLHLAFFLLLVAFSFFSRNTYILLLLVNEIDKSKSTSFKTTKLLYLPKLLLISLAVFVLVVVVVGFQSLLRTEYCCFSLFIFHRAVDSVVWGVPTS